MSVESGLGAPVEKRADAADPAPAPGSRAPLITRARPRRATRDRRPRADAVAETVSTPAFRGQRGRPPRQGRRVRRVIRRVELWSVLKISLLFNAVMLAVALGAVALLWGLASTTGLVDDLEGFLRDSGFEDFRFQGDRMFRQVAFIGAVGAVAFSVFMVLATALVNLISELTGGIRVVIIEEIVEPAPIAEERDAGTAPIRARPVGPDEQPRRRRRPPPGGPSAGPPTSPPERGPQRPERQSGPEGAGPPSRPERAPQRPDRAAGAGPSPRPS